MSEITGKKILSSKSFKVRGTTLVVGHVLFDFSDGKSNENFFIGKYATDDSGMPKGKASNIYLPLDCKKELIQLLTESM